MRRLGVASSVRLKIVIEGTSLRIVRDQLQTADHVLMMLQHLSADIMKIEAMNEEMTLHVSNGVVMVTTEAILVTVVMVVGPEKISVHPLVLAVVLVAMTIDET
ncbi:hypothetical protein Hamer_G022759 [Homarus americanus]|uniref:Uncharacterized protein n=1 Tax=Homarus americanus TaxID=6706 RepID=A0A8J5MZ40_HOMAM|nr:hypothetical protein Hamer_G022759 [Homarus americanus]